MDLSKIQKYPVVLKKIYKQHIPARSYARKATARPNLSERVQQTIKYLLQSKIGGNLVQPLKMEHNQGYEFPCFFILKRKVYYQGQWSQGLPHGKGRVYFTNGCFFEGWFNMGEAEGQDNIFIYSDGSFYRGSFKNSKKSGNGKLYFHNGFQYSGPWLDNKPHGEDGIETYPDGSRYVGDFVNGIKSGKGQYFWPDGKVYFGDFKNGYMEGRGSLKKGTNSYFEGQFLKNQKQGRGVMVLPYGSYEGSFAHGLMNGQGTFRWKDGKVFKGSFYNGKMHGEGTLSFPNGRIIVGQWQQGQNIQVYQISANNRI